MYNDFKGTEIIIMVNVLSFAVHALLLIFLQAQETFTDDVQDAAVMLGAGVYSQSHHNVIWTSVRILGKAYINIKPSKSFHT